MKDEKDSQNEAENIRVAVRCRPMNDRELREQAVSCFKAEHGNAVLTNLENPSERHEFGFDHVYGIDVPQVTVFNDIGAPILDRAFGGYNGTIFAYGQTGSGKTFSMSGVRGHDELEGLIPRMNRAIFERIQREKTENPQKLFLVECSFFEIYNEIIYDLLDSSGNAKKNKGGLEIKEHAVLGIYVKDLQERVVESREEVIDLMQQGQNARTVGYTQMNSESSRSHSIFIIKIHQKDATDETKNIFAKINLVDLAGSERAASTGAQGDRLKEGANINKSLSALGNVINALVEASRAGKKVFIPYRNSKLTRVLQESLGGNSLCSMLATLSPANINFIETLSTLKYASRAKSIKVNAKKNEASSQISQLNEEIAALKKKLTEQTSSTLGLDPKEKDEIVKKYEQQIKEMDRVRLQTWEDKAKLSKQHEMERKRLAKEKALADQKVREERTRKWKLLEEKGDVELMLRALRDLDRTSSAAGCAPVEDKWLVRSQTMKSLETEAKDHRTMIVVFKDAIDKDVDHWAKRLVRQDSTVTAAARRDDTAATHMIVNQLCSKLQNVFDESKQLVEMEKKLTEDGRELINEMITVLTMFKEKRKAAKSAPPVKPAAASSSSASTAEAQRGREDDQIQEEREKGLSMTLALILRQRAKLIATIKTERQKMFGLSKVCTHFTKYMDSFIAAFGAVKEAESGASIEKWTAAKENLAKASAVWDSEWAKGQAIEETADSVPVTYTPKGEVAALGLESKLIPDDCLYPSSRKGDAKLLRMNSPNFWIPDENDAVAFAVVDLEFPRFVQSISVRGGNTAGSAPIATSTTPQPGGGSSLVPVTTFELKPTGELLEIVKLYKLDEISGEHESTHEIMGHVMSWQDLLKTTLLPTKLFARPPIRFLHDVISVVIHNTGYAKDLFSPSERDYVNLTSKTERVDYLTKILDFVQEDYRSLEGGPTVMIAATASNILAGKEPTDTLKFLCYFSLAALQWAIKNPPAKANKPADGEKSSDETVTSSAESSSGAVDPAAPQGDGESQKPSGRSGWVKKMRISTSLTGRTWRILGDFDANTDDSSLQMISFPPGTNAVGRFVQLTCIECHELPLFQVEIYGQEASESDELVKTIESMGVRASAMVLQLQASASLFAEEARASWEKAKDAEREKQEELIKLMAEITRLKQSNAEFEKEIKELQQSKTTLQQNVKTETKRLAEEKAKCDKLQGELQQNTTSIADIKKEKEALSVKLNEHVHSIQTMTLQLSTQTKELESLQKSKTGLEELCSTLRTQLQAKSQEEGHQESKLASVMSDLMAVNVQLDEYRRRYESSEQMRKEQEAANQQMHTQLQDQLTQLSEKERLAQKLLNEKVVEAGRSLEAIQTEKDDIRRKLDDTLAAATASNAANEALHTQMSALRDELEVWKSKVAEAQAQASPTKAAIEAANAASTNASQQASEQMMLEAQTKELRCIAELEKMELKVQSFEQKQRDAESKLQEVEAERDTLARRITELEELEDELQMQLQVVTEERDAARAKEEQLFVENNEKEQEIERIRDGYVWVTDRMNSKEDELAEMQEQLEKYQALLQITTAPGKKKDSDNAEIKHLLKLYALATGQSDKQASSKPEDLVKELTQWIENAKSAAVPSQAKPSSAAAAKTDPAAKMVIATAPAAAPAAAPTQQPPTVATVKSNTAASPVPAAVDTSATSSPPSRAKTPRHDDAPSAKTTASVSTQEVEAPKLLVPKVKAMPESNQAASKEAKDELPKRAKSPREPHQPEVNAAAKPEMDIPAPTKPATPRREASPPTSARKVNGSNGTTAVLPSNQSSQRPEDNMAVAAGGDDAYDDDFDADEPDEAKKRMGRKASAKAVQPAQ